MSDVITTAFAAATVASAVGWHVRRLVIAPPFHLVAAEQRAYRTVSLLTVGVILSATLLAHISPALWAVAAAITSLLGSRIGARLHLARPMVARLACVPLPDDPDIDDCAYLKCVRTLPGTHLSWYSHAVPDPVAILMTPRTMSRTALRDLPFTLVGGAHEAHIPAAVAFLREARQCGCLRLIDEADLGTSDGTSSDRGWAA